MKITFTLKLILIVAFLIIQTNLSAQSTRTPFVHYKEFQKADSNKLFLRIENFNFIKNNEYNGDFAKGATWIGYLASPKLVYYPSSKVRIEAGARFQKYSGRTSFTETEPVFSVNFMPTDNFSIILGSLNQNNNHSLSEPLYEPERFFTDEAENGLQIQYKKERFNFDTWVNWEKFILEGDPFQERFTFGLTSKYRLTNSSSPNNLSFPLQALFTHRGGEIDSSDGSVQTLANYSAGLEFSKKIENSRITSWNAKAIAFYFADNSSVKEFGYDKGYAVYPQVGLTTKHSNITLGYWNADSFVAPKGSFLFQSTSRVNGEISEDKRELVTFKYYYEKKISTGVVFGGKIDCYYDLKNNDESYATAIYLRLNGDFFLKKLKWN